MLRNSCVFAGTKFSLLFLLGSGFLGVRIPICDVTPWHNRELFIKLYGGSQLFLSFLEDSLSDETISDP